MNPIRIRECQAMMQSLITEYPELLENEKLKADMLESETDFYELLRVILIETRLCETHAGSVGNTIQELSRRKERLKGRGERQRAIMLAMMQSADMKTVKLPEATLSASRRAPEPIKPDSLDGFDECFIKYKPELDWAAVKAAIKDGKSFPGIQYTNGGVTLTVRS